MRTSVSVFIEAAVLAVGAVALQNVSAADNAKGKDLYNQSCASCHGANGKGSIQGVPDFTAKKGVLSQVDSVLIDHIANGFQGPGSPMAMPPKGGNTALAKDDIAAILAYMHQAFDVHGK